MDWRKGLKSYSSIITKNIPLFLAVGFLNILFSDNGLFPNPDMSRISEYIYRMMIPALLGYYAGKRPGNQVGGIAGAIASAGFVCAGTEGAILGSVLVGAAAGWLTDSLYGRLEKHLPAGFEMIVKNGVIGALGVVFAAAAFYGAAPVMDGISRLFGAGASFLLSHGLLPAVNLLVEPMKVLFMNNWLNHGLLIPLGMEQLEHVGNSVLFLLESNPGPGLGVLLVCYLRRSSSRKELGTAMAVHALGGIHEVYFPYVISDIRLLAGVTAGGVAGTWWFVTMGAALKGPVSPGSVLMIFMMADISRWLAVAGGILLSAAVTVAVSWGLGALREPKKEEAEAMEDIKSVPFTPIRSIYVVCDAGLGSSAMGAALLRRKLKEAGCTGVSVLAAAFDDIPADAQLLICQRDFYEKRLKGRQDIEIRCVERLTEARGYVNLIEEIKERLIW